MGKADNRRTPKTLRRTSQRRHLARLRKKMEEGKANAGKLKAARKKVGTGAPAAAAGDKATVTRRPT